MKKRTAIAVVVVLLGLGAGGWWYLSRGHALGLVATPAEFTAQLRGKYQGTVHLPATLNWCPVTRVGVLEAVSGDTGVALVLYEQDSLTPGAHAISAPELAAAGPKPGASFVIRWLRMRPDTGVTGFRSDGGTVRVRFSGGSASGDVNVHMRAPPGPDSLIVQGVFTAVPVVTPAKGCT